ncbi:MAG TPA: ABC transporter ATP-binding protein [Clostridiaceae bacterium]|nr:ABC transporter ATP-binding protein [Clostridiaceae bacterium]
MQKPGIQIQNLSKCYGKKQALSGVSLNIKPGMFGLLGKNGAGKTTLMKIIATLLKKQEGNVTVCGIPVEKASEVRKIIGYLPQDFNMYRSMTVYQALDYLGVLSGMSGPERKDRISTLLAQVNLTEQAGKKVRALSGGMKQRLGIAQTLLHDPKVLIVDEPTAGLDPEERVRFRNLLCEVAENKTVILSTHIVGDVEATCEDVAILHEGRILFDGTVTDLCRLADGSVYMAEVSQKELAWIRSAYIITAVISQGKKSIVRFLSPDGKPPAGKSIAPNAEDAYIFCLNRAGKGGSLYDAI